MSKGLFITLLVIASLIFIGAVVSLIYELAKNRKPKREYKDCYGVSFLISDLLTVEELVNGLTNETTRMIDNYAKELNCWGVIQDRNEIIYLFLVDCQQKEFYNSVKQLAKAKLIAEPIKAERVAQKR